MVVIPRRTFVSGSAGALASLAFLSDRVAAETQPELHDKWNEILKQTVTTAGWVDYARIRRELSATLRDYLNALGASSLAFSGPNDELAFWINAYNALCVQTLLDAGLPEEVPHSKLFGRNIFSERRVVIAGEKRSLDDIEHGIIRKRFADPRIHAAVVCGASSCPRLRAEAFVGERLSSQLDEECRSWLERELTRGGQRKNYLDRRQKIFYASKIFDWYEEDFGGNTQGVLAFIRRFVSAEDRAFLEQQPVELEYLPYDWRLNTQ